MLADDVNQAAEAICEILHHTDFKFLGETGGGRGTWWTRGDTPKRLRVEIERNQKLGQVDVVLEFANVAIPGRVVRVRKEVGIDCRQSPGQRYAAIQQLGTYILETYRDILAGTGLAGRVREDVIRPNPRS